MIIKLYDYTANLSNLMYCTISSGTWSCNSVTISQANVRAIALDRSSTQKLYVVNYNTPSSGTYECGTAPTFTTCTSVTAVDNLQILIGSIAFDSANALYACERYSVSIYKCADPYTNCVAFAISYSGPSVYFMSMTFNPRFVIITSIIIIIIVFIIIMTIIIFIVI